MNNIQELLWEDVSKIDTKETEETGVIYLILNVVNNKAYVGQAYSIVKNGNQKARRQGAEGRMYKHIKAALNNSTECPIFYEDIRKFKAQYFRPYTLVVCDKEKLDELENYYTKRYQTYDPKFGYNYFVGKNKPMSAPHVAKYKGAKAESNIKRAKDGAMRQCEHSKNLPPNINYRVSKRKGVVVGEGYFVQIKINDKLRNKAFLSMGMSMQQKLQLAIQQLEKFKKEAQNIQINK